MKATTILDGIRVASPCSASWDSMAGDDQARFCSLCGKNVYNLSAMSNAEAVAFVADREGEVCVRFYRRSDGTTLTGDCPVGASQGRKSRWRMLAGLGLVGLGLGSTTVAAIGLGSSSDMTNPSGSISSWIDWAMIKLGLRTPPQVTMGMVMDISSLKPASSTTNCPEDSTTGHETISADEF